MTSLITLGHGTRTIDEFLELCRGASLAAVVDIRSAPGSRRHPHFARERMQEWLPAAGIDYRWERRLGGFRKPLPESPNAGLRHPAFRGYADHMATADFRTALAEVLALAAEQRTAVMCSETLWWRCHRRLVADYAVLVCGAEVLHLMPDGTLAAHRPTDSAIVVEGDRLIYPPTDEELDIPRG